MSKPNINRSNSIEQWRILGNRVSDNLGDPADVVNVDAPDNSAVNYTNGNDSYPHPSDEMNAIVIAINAMIAKKLKRSGDTITGSLNIKQNLGVAGSTTLGDASADTITINGTEVSIPNNLNFDLNTLYLDSTNNRVGIGQVPNSTETFQVNGNSKLTGTLEVTANTQLDGDLDVRGGDLTTNQTTFNLLNDTATTINLGTVVTTLNIGNNTLAQTINVGVSSTAASTYNFGTGATASATKTVNIGTVIGASGVSNVNIGASAGTTTIKSPTTIAPLIAGSVLTANNIVIRANTADTTGTITIPTATASTATANGALVVAGGVGVGLKVYAGSDISSATNIYSPNHWGQVLAGGSISIGANSTDTTGTVTITSNTVTMSAATTVNVNGVSPTFASTSTGVLTLFNTNILAAYAFGAATEIVIGATSGSIAIRNSSVTIGQITASTATSIQSPIVNLSTGTVGITTALSTLESTTSSSASLITNGGLWVNKKAYVVSSTTTPVLFGQNLTGGTITLRANETDLTTGYVAFPDSSDASSAITGSARFSGGVGISKKLYVTGDVQFSSSLTANGTGNTSITQTGTVTINPTGVTNVGTLAVNTVLIGNIVASTAAQTVTITPTGAAGTVTIAPGTLTGTINNMSVGASVRSTGAFTTLTANDTTTLTRGTESSSTITGTLQVTGGAGFSGKVYAVGVYSDTISSIGTAGNGDITISGIGTGKVQIADDMVVTGTITVSTGDIVLSSGGDVIQTITSGVSASTANVFATSNTDTLNLGDNATVLVGNASKNTTIRGPSIHTGVATFNNNINQVGTYTTSTGTGNISLNGKVITTIQMSSDTAVADAEHYTAKATSASTASQSILSFSASTYSSAEVVIQAWDGTTRQLTKVLLSYNGTDTSITEFGTVIAGTSQIATYSTDINGGNIRLLVVPKATTSTTYKMAVCRFLT